MKQKPRSLSRTFFNARELLVSVVQGIVIAIGVLGIYQYSVSNHFDEQLTRSMVFATIICANIFLTLVNRSTINPVWVSIRYRNALIPGIVGFTLTLVALILYVSPISAFFQVRSLSIQQLLLCVGVSLVSVIWIEAIKLLRNHNAAS